MSLISSLFGKESVVGIDIGSHTIKAVQIEPHRHGWRVLRAGSTPTPSGSVRDGAVQDIESVSSVIGDLLRASSMDAASAVVAVSGPTVAVRQIRLPRLPDNQLARVIRFEAAKHLPNTADDMALAYEVMGASADDSRQSDAMLVAAPRAVVESRVAAIDRLGIDTAAVDIEAFALQRAIVEVDSADYADKSLRALVDIGATHTEVTLMSGDRFVLTRSVPIAGDVFSTSLVQHYSIDVAEAEARKTRADMSVLVSGVGERDELELAKVIQTSVDDLLREIRRSIQFFQSQLNESGSAIHLSEILLTGGAAQMRGLPEFVTARLGIPARLVDPMLGSRVFVAAEAENELHAHGPAYGIALGLALKESMPNSGTVKR